MTAGRKQEHSGTLGLYTPSCAATVIDDHQWVDLIDGSDATDDKLLLVDGITGARVAVRHRSWNSLVEAIEFVVAGHCGSDDCYGLDPAQSALLAALISELIGDQPVDPGRLAAGLMARGVSGPTRKPQPDNAQPNPRTNFIGGDTEHG